MVLLLNLFQCRCPHKEPLLVGTNISNTSGIGSESPCIAIDPFNNVHVVWREIVVDVSEKLWYRWKAASGSWSDAVNIFPTEKEARTLFLTCDAAGTLHIAWQSFVYDTSGRVENDILYSRKTVGRDWSVPETIRCLGLAACPVIEPDGNNNLHLIWADGRTSDTFYSFRKPDSTWTTPKNLSSGSIGWRDIDGRSMTIDKNNNVHAVWAYYAGDSSCVMYVTQSGDDWTTPKNIVPPKKGPGGAYNIIHHPSIITDRDGAIHVVWQDDRAGGWNIFHTVKSPFAGWSQPQDLSQHDEMGACYRPSLNIDADGTIYLMFSSPERDNLWYCQKEIGRSFTEPESLLASSDVWFDYSFAIDGGGNLHIVYQDGYLEKSEIYYVYFKP